MNLAHKIEPMGNPIDVVENILNDNAFEVERRSDYEVVAEIQGKWNDMLVFFSWEEAMQCLHISCLMNIENQKSEHNNIYELLALINDDLWVGHFSYWTEREMPVYRHSVFCNKNNPHFFEQVAQVFDIAVKECERMYPVFNVVLTKGMTPSQALFPKMMETIGQA